jgi:hypothetical protein
MLIPRSRCASDCHCTRQLTHLFLSSLRLIPSKCVLRILFFDFIRWSDTVGSSPFRVVRGAEARNRRRCQDKQERKRRGRHILEHAGRFEDRLMMSAKKPLGQSTIGFKDNKLLEFGENATTALLTFGKSMAPAMTRWRSAVCTLSRGRAMLAPFLRPGFVR